MPAAPLDRRHVLRLFAAAPLGAAMVAPAACAAAEADLPDPAAPWRSPGAGEQDPRRHALAHAILAPNPHNMQPWLIDLVGADSFLLRVDLARLLPATDPPNRQITIGCGAFLELMDLAARETGHRAEITLWPEGEPQPVLDGRPIAAVRLVPDASVAKDSLYAQIVRRRTSRLAFSDRAPPAADLEAVRAAGQSATISAFMAASEPQLTALRDLTKRAWRLEATTPHTIAESIKVTRIGKAEIARDPWGLALQGPVIEIGHAVGLVTRKTLADPNSFAFKEQLAFYDPLAASARAFLGLTAATTSRADEIAAGRAYARANLEATRLGLSMQPMSQALQEFPEMAALKREMDALTAAPATGRLHMLARIGYGEAVPPSPRRPWSDHLA
ncbi:MAG: twin-arginine translocation pathway signal protein [Alphaproteobacteria bacterium]|nr:twin-arginine translocation pathway signal protein [Alphaproteobacteria bacterium]